MNWFRREVEKRLNKNNKPKPDKKDEQKPQSTIVGKKVNYKVKINTDELNVRKEPKVSTNIVTTVKRNEVFTIVEEYKSWGKLKSEIGWISLNYVIKVKTTKKKSVTTIAKEVIAGKWGNGTSRKKKIIEAGYDYSEVQKKVKELMK